MMTDYFISYSPFYIEDKKQKTVAPNALPEHGRGGMHENIMSTADALLRRSLLLDTVSINCAYHTARPISPALDSCSLALSLVWSEDA